MKTTILIHENENWTYYPDSSNKIEHVSRITAGECFFFDPVNKSATSVVPQPATEEDPRAGHLNFSIKFDEDEVDWFLNRPSRIKGLKELLKSISKEDAKRYALEISALPKKEIEERAIEFDAKADSLNQAETVIALQMMTSIIQTVNPEIYVIARNKNDNLIISVLKFLPKALRKVEISMPWSSGLDLGRISITGEDELPVISRPMYVVTESSQKLISNFPEQFAAAKRLVFGNIKPDNGGRKPSAPQNKTAVPTPPPVKQKNNDTIIPLKKNGGNKNEKVVETQNKNIKIADIILFSICEILLVAGYICYLKYFADPNHIYIIGFCSVMVGILFTSLIFNLTDKNK